MATALDMQAAYAAARREARKRRTLARQTSESRAATTLAPPLPAPCPGVVRYHPEFLSRPGKPHPLFQGLIEAAQERLPSSPIEAIQTQR